MNQLNIDLREHVMLVTLNRPDIHNAISHQSMIDELVDVCHRANEDKNIHVMILTGAGKSFCAGGNIKDMRDKSDMFAGSEPAIEHAYKQGIQRIPLAFAALQVPAIAAINGAAIGAGFDLAMMCDIRIASDNARFAESFVKLGLIPGDGGAWFLPRRIGASRAAQLTLSGMQIPASTALDWGIISECTRPEHLLPRAWEIALEIASNPPQAVRESKRLLKLSEQLTLQQMLDDCAQTQARLHHTDEHMNAVRMFLEKSR
jgi:enoyl-CoA hydratase/carnithine racemase